MKQSELKNKMDAIFNDFDKQELWSGIEKKNNKRRSTFFWWFLFCSILLIFISLFYYVRNLENKPQLIHIDKATPLAKKSEPGYGQHTGEKQKIINDTCTSSYISTMPSVAYSISPSNKYKVHTTQPAKKENLNQNNDYSLPYDNNAVRKYKTSNRFSKIKTISDESQQQVINETRNSAIKSENERSDESSTITPAKSSDKMDGYVEMLRDELPEINTDQPRLFSSPINLVAKLPLKSCFIRKENKPLELYLSPLKNNENIVKFLKKNSIMFSFGVGYDNQSFSSSIQGNHRRDQETNLEARYLALSYARSFGNWALETTLIGAQNQTEIHQIKKNASWKFVNNGKTIEAWSGNEYLLYNEYQRLDASINLTYYFKLTGQLNAGPMLGMGYNILSKNKGNYFNLEGQLMKIEDANEYVSNSGLFYSYGFKIRQTWKQEYVFDLSITGQSKRNLVQTSYLPYQQTISPVSLMFALGKMF